MIWLWVCIALVVGFVAGIAFCVWIDNGAGPTW